MNWEFGETMDRNKNLDFIKGIMILFVILTHSSFVAKYRNLSPIFPLFVDMAVPVFMVISGYVNSGTIHAVNTIRYNKVALIRKSSRIILPFLPVVIFELAYWIASGALNRNGILVNVVFQGWGSGGYYPAIMLQLIIIFPLLYWLSKRKIGCVIILAIDMVSEAVFTEWGGVFRYDRLGDDGPS